MKLLDQNYPKQNHFLQQINMSNSAIKKGADLLASNAARRKEEDKQLTFHIKKCHS